MEPIRAALLSLYRSRTGTAATVQVRSWQSLSNVALHIVKACVWHTHAGMCAEIDKFGASRTNDQVAFEFLTKE